MQTHFQVKSTKSIPTQIKAIKTKQKTKNPRRMHKHQTHVFLKAKNLDMPQHFCTHF